MSKYVRVAERERLGICPSCDCCKARVGFHNKRPEFSCNGCTGCGPHKMDAPKGWRKLAR